MCLEDPFSNEALCCYTGQPNKGIFAPGSHTKNLLVTPVRIRQQRVRSETAETPFGGDFVMRWPVLSRDTDMAVLDQVRHTTQHDHPVPELQCARSTAPWYHTLEPHLSTTP